MDDIKTIEKDIKRKLSSFRYQHTLMVVEEAKKLARYYQLDEEKASVASLLHDIAKEFTEEENRLWIAKYHLPEELLKEEWCSIVHADIGAVVSKAYYGVDEDIANAIKYHTIGNVAMNQLAKVVFIADKIGRKEKNEIHLLTEKLSYQDLDKAILFWIERERERLESRGKILHPNTIKLLKFLLKNKNCDKI